MLSVAPSLELYVRAYSRNFLLLLLVPLFKRCRLRFLLLLRLRVVSVVKLSLMVFNSERLVCYSVKKILHYIKHRN